MIYNLPFAEVLHKETIMEYDFNSDYEGWEIVSDEDEKSFIKDSYYWMENKSKTRWKFYHKKLPVKTKESFIINTTIELLSNSEYGQFGLVWGFDKPHSVLNKFSVSTETNRFTVSKFEKDHNGIFHRFHGKFQKVRENARQYFLSIMLLDNYYFFFIDNMYQPVYICHKNHLKMEGYRFGFYVEPGIMIRTDSIKIQRLITQPDFNGTALMPFGSEQLKGE